MFHALILAVLPLACAVLHRLRGGGILPGLLPRFAWIAITTVVIAALCLGAGAWWAVSITLGAAYALWVIPGWMPELAAAEGAIVPADQVMSNTWDVRVVLWLSGGHPVFACYLRAILPLLPPMAVLLALDAFGRAGPFYDVAPLVLIAIAFWPIYRAAFKRSPTNQSAWAEPAMGAVFGVAVAGVAALTLWQ